MFRTNTNNFQTNLFDWTLTSTSIPGHSGPGSNSNEGDLHTPKSSRTEASTSDAI